MSSGAVRPWSHALLALAVQVTAAPVLAQQPGAAPAEPAPAASPPAPAAPAVPPTDPRPAASPGEAPSALDAPLPPIVAPAALPAPVTAPPVAPPAPSASGSDAAQSNAQKDAGKDSSGDEDDTPAALAIGARLMVGFEYRAQRSAGGQTDPADSEYGFELRQIRLRAKGDLADQFRASVSFELADALDPDPGAGYQSPPYLRTASIEWRPSRELRVRAGRFKRPFSRLELTSASTLPILRRGLFNSLALEDNQVGDRAIGVMASGRVSAPKLRWYLSLMNPSWSSTLDAEGVDVGGRVEWTIIKGLVLGVNALYKDIDFGVERVREVAYGGDVALKLGDAHFLLESSDAPLVLATGRPRARGALLMFDYELALRPDMALQPVVFVEYADADTSVLENESLRLVVGANLIALEGFRVMPQLELVRSLGDTSAANPWLESERLSLIFSLVL